MCLQGLRFSANSVVKTNAKKTNTGRMASIGISDVATASVYLDKTHLKKLMKIITITTKLKNDMYNNK